MSDKDVSAPTLCPITRRRVLLIDDDASVLRAVTRILGRHHDVFALDSAEAALELLSRDHAFDAVLCDLMMPGMQGDQFVAAVAERFPDLRSRVTIVTGGASTERTAEFLRATDLPTVIKPVRLLDLMLAIEDAAVRPSRQDGQ